MTNQVERYVIDAGMSDQADVGLFCFCPVDDDGAVIIGLSVLSDLPPGEMWGVYHQDGQAAAEAWCNDHTAALILLSNALGQPV